LKASLKVKQSCDPFNFLFYISKHGLDYLSQLH
jgi:hypothetical protein